MSETTNLDTTDVLSGELTAEEVYDRHGDVIDEWADEDSTVGAVARAIVDVATEGRGDDA